MPNTVSYRERDNEEPKFENVIIGPDGSLGYDPGIIYLQVIHLKSDNTFEGYMYNEWNAPIPMNGTFEQYGHDTIFRINGDPKTYLFRANVPIEYPSGLNLSHYGGRKRKSKGKRRKNQTRRYRH